MDPSLIGRSVLYAVLHSDDTATDKNTGSIFSCPLPQHVRLDGWKNWRIALHRLVCERPQARAAQDGDIVEVRLQETCGVLNPKGVIATLAIFPRSDLADQTFYYEPKEKRYFALNCDHYPEFRVSLLRESGEPLHSSYVRRTTIVLEFKKMFLHHRQEHVPITFTSVARPDYPNNVSNAFQHRLPPMYTNTTGRSWFAALVSITHSPRFLLTPAALNDPVCLTWKSVIRRDMHGQVSQTDDDYYPCTVQFAKSELEGKSVGEMMKFFTGLFKAGRVPLSLARATRKFGGMVWKCSSASGGILNMPLGFAALYGFVGMSEADINSDIEFEFVEGAYETLYLDSRLFHPRLAYVHANFVEPSSNGAQQDRLLAVVPIPNSFTNMNGPRHVTQEIGQLCYHKVSVKSLQHCTIELRDKDGRPLPFVDNLATVSLTMLLEINK
jgi:hypothetical protein